MEIYVFDYEMNDLGMVDEFQSCIWDLSYSDFGDFEIYMDVTEEALNLFTQNRLVARSRDITTEDGVNTCDKIMIVEQVEITTDDEAGDHLKITGRSLGSILERRVMWQLQTFSGTAPNVIANMINTNAVSPSDSKRKFPNFSCTNKSGVTDTLEIQYTGDNLGDKVVALCTTYNIGHKVVTTWTRKNGKKLSYSHVFTMYSGIDRTFTNATPAERVIFSESNENIYSTDLIDNGIAYKSIALVGGEGEGSERRYTTVEAENLSGIARRELFVDARDVSSDDGAVSEADYIKLLQSRGNEKLAETFATVSVTGDFSYNSIYKYGTDFDIGDKVSVMIKYVPGTYQDTRISGAIETDDSSGYSVIPQFDTEN